MDLTQRLKSRLADYSSDEFIVDEHAMKRCRDYHNLDIEEVLDRLRKGDFSKVVKNDSKKAELQHYESFKARIPKSNKYE